METLLLLLLGDLGRDGLAVMHDLQAKASLRDASCLFLGLLQAKASLRDGLLLRRHLATDVAQNGVQAEPGLVLALRCLGNAGDRDLRRHQDGVLIGVVSDGNLAAGHLAHDLLRQAEASLVE